MKLFTPEPILDILLPRRCLLCTQDIQAGSLCQACDSLCHPCPKGPFTFAIEQPGALFYYELALRDVIKAAKFHRSLAHARALVDLIEKSLAQNDVLSRLREFAPAGVSYVPTHWIRKSLRGLDLPSMFAHLMAKKLKVPLVHALEKTKLGDPQSSLQSKSERLQAVLGLFKIKKGLDQFERLLIVDDIVTTGATFQAASKVLFAVSKEIRCLAIAKTP